MKRRSGLRDNHQSCLHSETIHSHTLAPFQTLQTLRSCQFAKCAYGLGEEVHACGLTSRHAVPGPSVSDAVFEAGVIVVLAAGGSLRVRHDWVVNGVGLRQRLEHHIVWTGAVLVVGALEGEHSHGRTSMKPALTKKPKSN